MGLFDALGLSGEQGRYFQARQIPELQTGAYSAQMGDVRAGETNAALRDAIMRGGNLPEGTSAPMARSLAEDPFAGQKLAERSVLDSELGGGVYGDKGLQGSLNKEYQAYEGSGLTPETQTELDQAKAQIARQYGSEEGGLAQALASRGLGAAPSGMAVTEFTGLRGNLNEQLAKANLDAAMKKIQMKRDLATQRMNLANQAFGAKNQTFQNQLSGVESTRNAQRGAASTESAQNQAMLAREHEIANQNMQEIAQQHEYKSPTLGEAFGAGIMNSATAIGATPGKMVQSYAGGKTAGIV